MRRSALAFLGIATLALSVGQPGHAQQPPVDGGNLWFSAEFSAHPDGPAHGATLLVTFYGAKPGAMQAQEVLRHCLDAAIAMQGNSDIVAQARYSVSPGETERQAVLLTDGSDGLLYSAADKAVRAVTAQDAGAPSDAVQEQEVDPVASLVENRRVVDACKELPREQLAALAGVRVQNGSAERKLVVKAMRTWCKENGVATSRKLSVCISAISKVALATTPSTVTKPEDLDASIARGAEAYTVGRCTTCHRPGGRGGRRGPDLTDDGWLHCDGSIEGIRKVLVTGVPRDKLKDPRRPEMTPATELITDDQQLTDLAVYVRSLSQE